jgi:hypothetical protein
MSNNRKNIEIENSDNNKNLITATNVRRYDDENLPSYILGGGCCIFCLVVFLLLFFLIPRAPTVSYYSTTVNFDPTYYVLQSYKVNNGNMYSLKLYDFNTQLTTDSSGETLTGYGSLNDDDNSNYISANSEETITLKYVFNATAVEIATANAACFDDDGVTYTTTGTVSMETWATNFNSIKFGTYIITYFCSVSDYSFLNTKNSELKKKRLR